MKPRMLLFVFMFLAAEAKKLRGLVARKNLLLREEFAMRF